MPNSRDIQVVAIVVILMVLSVFTPHINTTPIRTILGIPMVLFLPGYALIAALFPGKKDLDGIERLALSFGLSIAVVPLLGLGLNFTPFGIRLVPILFTLSIFTLGMCTLAYFRRLKLPENERFSIDFSDIRSLLKRENLNSKSSLDKILSIALIFSILISITVLIYVVVTPHQGEKFTEFYILGDGGKAEGYPTQLEAGNNGSLIVGIVNHEYTQGNYMLKILLQNDTLSTVHVPLKHNSTWKERVYFIPEETGNNLKLEFLLYKEENFSAPYRELHLWVNVT